MNELDEFRLLLKNGTAPLKDQPFLFRLKAEAFGSAHDHSISSNTCGVSAVILEYKGKKYFVKYGRLEHGKTPLLMILVFTVVGIITWGTFALTIYKDLHK